ncbi:MAG: Type 1 glutamine amidotransferase-like domain-containing protein [Gemmatimonadetes bacterium]|nr:Type 1 glutamine amidotransferase-like domain-containing protein [Gemmatimonadota bacterium]
MRLAALAGCALFAACTAVQPSARVLAPATTTGPDRGTLFIAGGGALDSAIIARFVALAGGGDARIVVIPTAATEDSFPESWAGLRMFREAGARHLTLLHTRSRDTADSEAFTRPLRSATAVWLTGGRQWRLADSYLDTRTVSEIRALLDRDGVVGGTSAGASIQASYMVRGAVESNEIMMAPGYESGFGLLRGTAIDQHLTARGRQDDMLRVVRRHPALLGIGVDEGTALIVTRDHAEIAGRGRVAFYNTADSGDLDYYFLSEGGTFDLDRRITSSGRRVAPQTVRDEAEVLAAMIRLFDAMRTRDTAAIRALAHPDLHTFIPVEHDGRAAIRSTSLDGFIAQVAAAAERLDERPIRPEVRVDGRLASVWTYYDFIIGSNFSHCGTDAFNFVKDSTGWIITGLAYTIQREGCTR